MPNISDGSRDVTTAGTRVALATARTMACTVTVEAKVANTGAVFVGGNTIASGRGVRLLAGDSYTFPAHPQNIYNLQDIYVDAAVNAEGVTFVYAQR